MNRNILALVGALAAGAVVLAVLSTRQDAAQAADELRAYTLSEVKPGVMHVWKTPACGCCTVWVDHMRDAGFTVETEDLRDLSEIKARLGVGWELSSCHTAVVDGYVVEGHVPASVVRRLLEERPQVVGIAVPGMPIGSPGMEGPNPEIYDVLTFDREGRTALYERIVPGASVPGEAR